MKEVAETLKSLLDNNLVRQTLTKHSNIKDVVEKVIPFWGYDLLSRKPGPAYRDGIFVGTDLDLACFLYALIGRKAVIQLPTYKSLRPTTVKEGQVLSSKENRHGQILNLVSNQDTFVFSLQIKDMNVMTTDSVGDFRNFSLTNFDGDWYDGWRSIQFLASADENKFLTENKLWEGHTVVFNNFVHPNRWHSIYGQYYVITKLLIERLKDERKFYKASLKRMKEAGVPWPTMSGTPPEKTYPRQIKIGPEKRIKVSAFEVQIDFPEFSGGEYGSTYEAAESPIEQQNQYNHVKYLNRSISRLQFAVRATELAFFKYGNGRLPRWIKNAAWEEDYTEPGKRIKWDRLVLFQPAVGQRGVALRKRTREKTEVVSANY